MLLYCFATDANGYGSLIVHCRKEIGALTRPLSPLTSPRLVLRGKDDQIERRLERLRDGKRTLGLLYELQPRNQLSEEDVNASFTPWAINYFGQAQRFADNGYELLEVDPVERFAFWLQTVRKDRELLVELAIQRDITNMKSDELHPMILQTIELATDWLYEPAKKQPVMSAEEFESWFESCFDKRTTTAIRAKLFSNGPNSLKQEEFAKLMDRKEELTVATLPTRDNSAFPGSIPYLNRNLGKEKDVSSQIDSAIQKSLLRHTLRRLNSDELKYVKDNAKWKEAVSEAEILREQQRRAYARLSIEQLLALSLDDQVNITDGLVDAAVVLQQCQDFGSVSPCRRETLESRTWNIKSRMQNRIGSVFRTLNQSIVRF